MFYGIELPSRLMLGTAQYPSPAILRDAIEASGASVITVSLPTGWNFSPTSVCSQVVGLKGSVPGAPVLRFGSNEVL